jgi:hypothetical protein
MFFNSYVGHSYSPDVHCQGSAIGIQVSGDSRVDLVDGNTFTVIARGGYSMARGMIVDDRGQVKIGSGNTFDIREECESRANLNW